MAEELNREQVTERMQAIFRSSLEGDELDKALSSIDKRLDKFEGKWDGLIKWAETKYGKPQEIPDSADSEDTQAEGPRRREDVWFWKEKEQASADSGQPDEPEAAKEGLPTKKKNRKYRGGSNTETRIDIYLFSRGRRAGKDARQHTSEAGQI